MTAGLQKTDSISGFGSLLKASRINGTAEEETGKTGNGNVAEKKGEETLFTNYNSEGDFAVTGESPFMTKISEIENIRVQLMERILNMMQILYGGSGGGRNTKLQSYMRSLTNQMYGGSYQWLSVSTTTYVHTQEEYTAFTAKGVARTEDGRELSFGVSISMSREFSEAMEAVHMQPANLIDPLVINVGKGVTEISDQTFTFDLDCDGAEDEIKSIAPGSGFLAYDRNGDGVINDGGELFGARSGDGFKELSEFDSDDNSWIDESDEIYEKLRVWCRDGDGNDTLMTLKEADVGAIFLGKTETKFTSQGSDFAVNGQFRSSGIFLRESTGEAGAVHQIDIAKLA